MKKCPICGKQAAVRYLDHDKKEFIYKHITFKKTGRYKTKSAIYHHAKV